MKEITGPYRIRGHHIPDYRDYQMSKSPAEEYARNRTIEILQWRQDRPQDNRYHQDIIGTTRDDALRFYAGQQLLWETFDDLAKDAPVKLVAGQPDAHCNTCIIGAHCSMNDSSVLRGPSNFILLDEPDGTRDDARKIGRFREIADSMNVQYRVVQEIAVFTDAPPKPVESVIIRAADFKKVLKKFNPDK